MRVAIVGAGIAGLGAARALIAAGVDVTVFEAAGRPGGHVVTVAVPTAGARNSDRAAPAHVDRAGAESSTADTLAIDMGFIVCNRERYPLFFRMLGELGIATRPTAMSFSVSDGALEWGSASLSAVFAQRRRLVDPRHWRFGLELLAFLRRARADLARGIGDISLAEYLGDRRELRERFCVPLAAALWSLAPDHCGELPASTFLRFLDHHGMLSPVRPLAWHTVVGGSRRYVDALVAALQPTGRFTLAVGRPVHSIARSTGAAGCEVATGGAGSQAATDRARFDRVVIATHADTALALLGSPTGDERRVLGAFRYSANRTVLHTDRRFLPRAPAAHASWNYVADPDTARVAVTYSMTKLQGLPDVPYLVTLNPRSEPTGILHEVVFAHPQFDRAALAAQAELPRLAGVRGTYYAGAHVGFGFHEDGLRAGYAAAARLLADV